ncbi:MAG TPA: hypothetical protein VEU52_00340 [Candidatus Limnocylindrales bacterium]|nr:hypothetical protein [Candidatus Limnocylindrales bacterium]
MMIRDRARGLLLVALAGAFAILIFLAPLTTAAQSGPSGGTTPAAPADASKGSGEKPIPPAENSAPAKAAKPRKVITNEDIDAAHARDASKIGENGKYAAPIFGSAVCDDECAHQAHDQLGFEPEQEGEWQMQLAAARRNLAADSGWLRAYGNASQKEKMYCDFVTQEQNTILPEGNDYWARVDRAKHEKYVEDMGRTLSQGVQSASNQINQLIEGVRPVDPVRATIMGVISYQVFNSCPAIVDP